MARKPDLKNKPQDRIEGNKIILHDNLVPGPKTLKEVEIRTPKGKRFYKIIKTSNSGYLFN